MDKDVKESDPRSDVHYLGSSVNKAWKKNWFEPMTSATPVQRSINTVTRIFPQREYTNANYELK